MVAASPLQPSGMPSILDLPVGCRKKHELRHRNTIDRSRKRLAIFGHHACCQDPVGMLAAAGERPSAVNP